jgi:hypothetical protein
MSFAINLTPEDIEKLVKDSIMRAGFGQAIEKALAGMLTGYNNPIDAKLREHVALIAGQLIREHYHPMIRAAIDKYLKEKLTQEIVDKTTSEAVGRMIRAAENN